MTEFDQIREENAHIRDTIFELGNTAPQEAAQRAALADELGWRCLRRARIIEHLLASCDDSALISGVRRRQQQTLQLLSEVQLATGPIGLQQLDWDQLRHQIEHQLVEDDLDIGSVVVGVVAYSHDRPRAGASMVREAKSHALLEAQRTRI